MYNLVSWLKGQGGATRTQKWSRRHCLSPQWKYGNTMHVLVLSSWHLCGLLSWVIDYTTWRLSIQCIDIMHTPYGSMVVVYHCMHAAMGWFILNLTAISSLFQYVVEVKHLFGTLRRSNNSSNLLGNLIHTGWSHAGELSVCLFSELLFVESNWNHNYCSWN